MVVSLFDVMVLITYILVWVCGGFYFRRVKPSAVTVPMRIMGMIGLMCSVYLIIRHPWVCLIWFAVAVLIGGMVTLLVIHGMRDIEGYMNNQVSELFSK